METKKFTVKQLADILGPYARDLVNQSQRQQNIVAAFAELRDAVTEGVDLAKNIDALKGELETLRKSAAEERAALKSLEARKAELLSESQAATSTACRAGKTLRQP